MIGKTISHYQILEKIGEGAMGEVYLAQDTELRRKTALKFISSEYNSDPEFKIRFKHEAQAAAALNHPNIITIYGFGEFENRSYIVMEYLEGGSLKDLISTKSIQIEEAVNLGMQICAGLCKAHEAGTVHRDIKPANILLSKSGQIKIVDFGLALLQGGTGITRTGTTMGTPNYMSPEQARGEKLDLRSDIFSVGVVLYELLTGELPFRGDNLMIVLYAIVNLEPLPLNTYRSGISPRLQRIIDLALHKDIKARYRRMEELLADLEKEKARLVVPEPATATATIVSDEVPPPPKKPFIKPRLLQIGAAAILISAMIWGARSLSFFTSAPAAAISTSPAGAAVFLNDDSLGVTPLELRQEVPEKFALRLLKTDYFNLDTTISLTKGQAASFMFMLQPMAKLALSVKPSQSLVTIDGKALAPSRWAEVQLAPGEHQVVISAPGYQTKQDRLSLVQGKNPGRDYILELASTPPPPATIGAINIVSEPAGASIFLNDKLAGKTPFEDRNVPPGKYQVALRLEEHEGFSTNASVRAGSTTAVRGTLFPAGILDLDSDPKGAVIFVDDRNLGRAPQKVQARAGEHAIVMRAPGYKDYKAAVKVAKGETVEVAARLEILMGKLSVLVKPYGSIYIDNRPEEKDTNVRYAKELPAGEHRLKVVHQILGTWEKEVSVAPDKETSIEIDFNKQVTLTVTCYDESGNPLRAGIFVDNKDIKKLTPRQLTLTLGQHTIEVRREGYQLLEGPQKLLLEGDRSEPLRFTLKKNQ